MNISTTNVNFNGKSEVLYGLRKAAQEAHNIEINRSYAFGPRPINMEYLINTSTGKMSAYLDMVANDTTLSESINNLASNKPVMDYFKQILQPKKVPFGKINPLQVFAAGFRDAVKKSTDECKNGVEKFITAIKM